MTRTEILKLEDAELDKKVKIQGTRFDRKRKINNYTRYRMRSMFEKGKSAYEISKILNESYATVRYIVDDAWRENYNANRTGRHTGKTNITMQDRIDYKREIVRSRKMRKFA